MEADHAVGQAVEGHDPAPPVSDPAPDSYGDEDEGPSPFRWRLNLGLFLATAVSVFYTGAMMDQKEDLGLLDSIRILPHGWRFAVPLLAILLTHEFGHYIAARVHGVDASLPFFIPLPFFSPWGTMGAVIAMRGRIKSRNALLDIGASGPLAGLVVALPILYFGLLKSKVEALAARGTLEGQCLLYSLMKRVAIGTIPEGQDVSLGPMATAGWVGLFVTMLNLIATAQLDGGHIAYALFGPRQNRIARVVHAGLLLFFGYNMVHFFGPLLRHPETMNQATLGQALGNSAFWLVWYIIIRVMMRVGGRDHPPTEAGELSPVRKVVAAVSLLLFVALFMPTPWSAQGNPISSIGPVKPGAYQVDKPAGRHHKVRAEDPR